MLFVLNIEEKLREDALSLFRQQDCGIVHQFEIRKLDSVACFKKNMFAKIFKEQQCLRHFIIWYFFIFYKNRIVFYFNCLYILANNILLDCK